LAILLDWPNCRVIRSAMRIRRSVRQFFGALVWPAIAGAAIAYFGYHLVLGPRGLLALEDARAKLGIRQEQLAQASAARERLQHRISLLEPGSVDPDLVEELARGQLMDGAPGQVAVPRGAH
jgi:cell division protein FtsB